MTKNKKQTFTTQASNNQNLLNNDNRFDKVSNVIIESYFILLKAAPPTKKTFEKMKELLLPYLNNFVIWLIPKQIVIEYKSKTKIQVWSLNEHNLDSLNSDSLKQLWCSLTDESYKRIYSIFCNEFLRELEAKGNFIRRRDNAKFMQTHHIKPRFDNGSEDPTNRINLNIYYHGIAHLLRFFFSQNANDINGVNNSLRTESEIDVANQNRLSGQRQGLDGRPIGRPFEQGRVPTRQPVTAAQRAAGSAAGSASQRRNSYNRVKPSTRFVTTLRMIWNHSSHIETEVLLERSFEFFTVNNIVSKLNECCSVNLRPNQYHVFS
jgi:hypothetical protein